VVLDNLAPGEKNLGGSAEGYIGLDEQELTLGVPGHNWVSFFLHALPAPQVDGRYHQSESCFEVSWQVQRFMGQAAGFQIQLVNEQEELLLELVGDQEGTASLCLEPGQVQDGAQVIASVQAIYGDGTMGVLEVTEPFILDSSPPVIDSMTMTTYQPVCQPAGQATVEILSTDPHSPVELIKWKLLGQDWQELYLDETEPGQALAELLLAVEMPSVLRVIAVNGAGLESPEMKLELELHPDCGMVETTDDIVEQEHLSQDILIDPSDTVADTFANDMVLPGDLLLDTVVADLGPEPSSGSSASSGCTAGGTTHSPWILFSLMLFLGVLRRFRVGATR
jgi:hypothetical protein